MKIFVSQPKSVSRRQSGLSLLEMMVAVSLLIIMMLGLTAMFNQTQRAFRSGLKQVDVFEGGRAVMDMITRDIEQAVRTRSPEDWSMYYAIPPNSTYLTQLKVSGGGYIRTNILSEIFFYNYATGWSALGYRVLDPNNVDAGNLYYGSLFQFSTNFTEFNGNIPNQHLFNTFFKNPSTLTNQSMTRVADGVVHFKIKFYDVNGTLIPLPDENGNVDLNTTNLPPEVFLDTSLVTDLPNEVRVIFRDAVPAMVEVELGILEPQTLTQVKSLPPFAQLEYLQKQAGKVHIFRQQIPIRNAPR